ncbi:hypothetical protein IGB42_03171 [Andreprevotia sp. IGB-42]|uniref:DUF2782 domain-containing protein n=1 Tax=Andreprevotia sp. IGB-42 TaxID=2497473 RepID=UPI00157E933A|nr:DUF2782 domain-containing protein [Andreprevotia sp. IGB-42]KAF0812502.1 hypothetical protein IGB42_03171 [Andreprevotia sp. IGB-42]
MKTRLIAPTLIALGLLAGAVLAADNKLEAPPPLPSDQEVSNVPEPEVRIIEKSDATVAEYRLKGKLYKVKVTPKVGLPYYLIDNEGKGSFTRTEDMGDPELSVPQWVLFEF